MNYVVICKSAASPFEYGLPPRFLFPSQAEARKYARRLAAWRMPLVVSAAYIIPMALPKSAT